MGRVSVNNLREGMVLEEDLHAPNGRFILGKGAALKDNYIKMFKIWGITGADVEGEEDAEIAGRVALEEEALGTARSYVDSFFPPEDPDDACAAAVRAFCIRRFAEAFSSGAPPALIPQIGSLPRPPEGHFSRSFSSYAMAKNEIRLFSFPDIYFKIQEVISSPISSATSIAKVVGNDPNLAARILRLVNSSFYGFPNPIQSIPRAIVIIGSNELSSLALAVSTMKVFKNVPPEFVDMKSFWRHSIACGVFSRLLAYAKKRRSEERFFLAGLLHDLGRIILYTKTPREMTYALELSVFEKAPLWRTERRVFGFDHTAVGKVLMEEWRIPGGIGQLCEYHHSPESEDAPEEAAYVHIADYLANALRIGSSGSVYFSRMDRGIVEALELDKGDFEAVLAQGERQIREIMNIFLIS